LKTLVRASGERLRRISNRTPVMLVLSCVLLAGCPSDDPRTTPPPPTTPTVSGQLANGATLAAPTISAASAGSVARAGRVDASGHFIIASGGLSAPYLLQSSTGYAVIRNIGGIANATPLTELVLLERIRAPLDAYFSELFNPSRSATAATGVDFTQFTAANLAEAQQRAVRALRQQLGVTVPAALTANDFSGTTFNAVAGDPMFDTLTALQRALSDRGTDLAGFERDRIQEFRRCDIEQLDIALTNDELTFCPAAKQALADPDDANILVYTFTTADNRALTLRARDGAVLAVELNSGDRTLRCDAAACAPAQLDPAASDGSRLLRLSGTVLRDGSGATASLSGVLRGAIPGQPLPVCTIGTNALGILEFDDGSRSAGCYGFAAIDRVDRSAYDSQLGATDAIEQIEIRAEGAALAAVTIYHLDPDSFLPIADYRCQRSACNNVQISAADASGTRNVTIEGAVLPRINATNSSGPTTATLRGSFSLVEPSPAPLPNCAAAPADQTLTARVINTNVDWPICPPYDVDNGNIGGFQIDLFSLGRYPGGLIGDYVYRFINDFASVGSVTLVASPQGLPRRLEYQRASADRFACQDAACLSAVTIDAAAPRVAHAVRINAVTLQEVEINDLAGDRSVRIQGALRTVPDCFITGEGC